MIGTLRPFEDNKNNDDNGWKKSNDNSKPVEPKKTKFENNSSCNA